MGGSYVEAILQHEHPEWVGTPTDFISHAWRYDFKAFVTALREESDLRDQDLISEGLDPIGDKRMYWNDIFVEDQNATESKPEGYFFDAFRTAVTSIGRTVLVVAPLRSPIVLSRCWCVWEIFSTLEAEEAELCIAFPPSERAQFQEMLHNDFDGLTTLLSDVNTENSEAFVPHDKEKIHRIVRDQCEGGFQGVDGVICSGLRTWLCKMGMHLVNQEERDRTRDEAETNPVPFESTLTLMNQLGRMFQTLGKMNEAEDLLRRALEGRIRALGHEHSDTLDSYNNVANLLQEIGKLEEVEEILTHVVDVRNRLLGGEHADLLTSLNGLGTLYFNQGRLSEAEPLMQRVYQGWKEQCGPDSPNCLTCARNLAFILQSQHKLDEAEVINRDVLASSERVFGTNHPDTLICVNNLVLLLKERGNVDEALPMSRRVIDGFGKVYGLDHPLTLNATGNFGMLLLLQADDHGREIIARVLGTLRHSPHSLPQSHPWIVKFENALGIPGTQSSARSD